MKARGLKPRPQNSHHWGEDPCTSVANLINIFMIVNNDSRVVI